MIQMYREKPLITEYEKAQSLERMLKQQLEEQEDLEKEPKTWYWIDADGDNARCGRCGRLNHLYGTYCKHCGAKMVEPQEVRNQIYDRNYMPREKSK
jgi:hypothetical protein